VFFRQSAKRQATSLGLAGWARNLADGRVEAAVEGPAEAVAAWLAWCRKGPPAARVDGVQIQDEHPTGEVGFQVLPNP
jgi:acylphosphatase